MLKLAPNNYFKKKYQWLVQIHSFSLAHTIAIHSFISLLLFSVAAIGAHSRTKHNDEPEENTRDLPDSLVCEPLFGQSWGAKVSNFNWVLLPIEFGRIETRCMVKGEHWCRRSKEEFLEIKNSLLNIIKLINVGIN